MENLSHSRQPSRSIPSLPKKACNGSSGFGSSKATTYDGIFGGPPRFEASTLSPGPEDYCEIFGWFNVSSRSVSSIPVLDLPMVEEREVVFDVQSPGFDYREVFGGFDGLDFVPSYEELLMERSNDGDGDSSDEAWTPTETESGFGGTEHPGKSPCVSNERGSYKSGDGCTEFTISFNKACHRSNIDMANRVTHIIPGSTFSVDEAACSGVMKENHLKKSRSYSVYDGTHALENDSKTRARYSRNESYTNGTFVTVFDLNLKTQSSELPPLSEPPTLLKRDSNSSASKTNSPQYFDVEVDANSAALKDAMEKAQVRLESAKLLLERKRERVRIRAKTSSTKSGMAEEGKPLSSEHSDKYDGWKEATEFFELVRTEEPRVGNENGRNEQISERDAEFREQQQKEKRAAKYLFGKQPEWEVKGVGENHEVRDMFKNSEVENQATEMQGHQKDEKKAREGEGLLLKGIEEAVRTVAKHESEKPGELVKAEQEPNNLSAEQASEQMEKEVQEKESNRVEANLNWAKESLLREAGEKRHKVIFEWEEQAEMLSEALGVADNEKILNEVLIQDKDGEKQNLTGETEDEKKMREALELIKSEHGVKEACDKKEESDRTVKQVPEKQEKERRAKEALEKEEKEKRLKEAREKEENEWRIKEALEKEENERRLKEALEQEEKERRLKEVHEKEENDRRVKETLDKAENERRLKEALVQEEKERQLEEALKKEENEKKLKEALEQEEKERQLEEAVEKKENGRRLKGLEQEEKERRLREAFGQVENERRLSEACQQEEMEKRQREVCKSEDGEAKLKEAFERGEKEKKQEQACKREETEKRLKGAQEIEENGKEEWETCEIEQTQKNPMVSDEKELSKDECAGENNHEISEQSQEKEDVELLQEEDSDMSAETFWNIPEKNLKDATEKEGSEGLDEEDELSHIHEDRKEAEVDEGDHLRKMESREALGIDDENNQATQLAGKSKSEKMERTRVASVLEESGALRTDIKGSERRSKVGAAQDERGRRSQVSAAEEERAGRTVEVGVDHGPGNAEDGECTSRMPFDQGNDRKKFACEQEGRANFKQTQAAPNQEASTEKFIPLRVVRDSGLTMREPRNRHLNNEIPTQEERENERVKRERELEKEQLRKTEEEKEREREREKDRMEVGKRALVEARERLEKACAEARENSMAEKSCTEARLKAVRPQDRQLQSSTSFGSPRYPNSSASGGGVDGESAQRYLSRLERHHRTAERMAKALAEKNMRDLIVQREQAERNRLAETLDADVKRWSSGKEGNIRALLSTLQYILGPESGWQPIPLTEVITSAAVKKAYRKATLCVHPDKLQQRGASIQQKYICEKVFDLLKDAWNRFNSEER